jgi:chorismate mutase
MEKLDKLQLLRNQVDVIDRKMAELLELRLNIVKQIKVVKKDLNIQIEDKNREAEMLNRSHLYVSNQTYLTYYQELLKKVIEISKKFQEELK